MTKKYISLIFLILSSQLPANLLSPEHLIAGGNIIDPVDLVAVDLDGDGDQDVLAAGFESENLVWFEHQLFEAGERFYQHTIVEGLVGIRSISYADLDQDGDEDLIIAVHPPRRLFLPDALSGIFWLENRLNTESNDFSQLKSVSIPYELEFPKSAVAKDLNGDDMPDVVAASVDDDTLVWFENQIGVASKDFSASKTISTSFEQTNIVRLADIDLDTDQDIIAGSELDREFRIYENKLDEPSANFELIENLFNKNQDDKVLANSSEKINFSTFENILDMFIINMDKDKERPLNNSLDFIF